MTLPAAGWFPDPRDATRLRWWDGRAWGEATRALPARATEPVRPVVVAAAGPAFSVATGAAARAAAPSSVEARTWAYGGSARRFCLFAVVAVLAAIVSVAVNPWGACSLVAVGAGVLGVVRPGATGGWRVASRSLSVSAIVVAVATGAVVAVPLLT